MINGRMVTIDEFHDYWFGREKCYTEQFPWNKQIGNHEPCSSCPHQLACLGQGALITKAPVLAEQITINGDLVNFGEFTVQGSTNLKALKDLFKLRERMGPIPLKTKYRTGRKYQKPKWA